VAAQLSLFHYPLPVLLIPFMAVPAVIVISERMSQPAVMSSVPVVAIVEIEIVVKPQIAVVVVNAPAAHGDKSRPGNPYKMGSPDVAAEDICGNHKGPLAY